MGGCTSRNQYMFLGSMSKPPDKALGSPFKHNVESMAFEERFGTNRDPNDNLPIRTCHTYANTSEKVINTSVPAWLGEKRAVVFAPSAVTIIPLRSSQTSFVS